MGEVKLFTVHMPPRDKLIPALEKVLYSGYIGQGSVVEEFEKAFGVYIGNKNVLSLNSGTSALHLAYRLANVAGGEVITTPVTCTATNMPILANNADIVWADVDPKTGIIDPADIERKITPRTRAITVVWWGGQSGFPTREIQRIRNKYGIPIIMDAAHALGSKLPEFADFTCYSLQAIKHITTVDGGVLSVKDTDAYKRGKLLRWYGIDREGDRKDFRCEEDIKEWGYKFHMNDVAATMGLLQLDEIDNVVLQHQRCVTFYDLAIKTDMIQKPSYGPNYSWWLYTVRLGSEYIRNDFMHYMNSVGIQVSRVHERNDIHTAFAKYVKTLPGVDEFCSRMVCIPCHSALTYEQLQDVAETANQFSNLYSVGM